MDQNDWLTLTRDPVMYPLAFDLYLTLEDLYCFLLSQGKNTTHLCYAILGWLWMLLQERINLG